jgi:hypothetical protein
VELVVGGRSLSPSAVGCRLRDVMQEAPDGAKAGDIAALYLASWVGANSTEFSLSRIADNGTADVSLTVRPGDVDTVKFAVAMKVATANTMRCSLVASAFVPREDLVAALSEPGRSKLGFTADQQCVVMSDNFSRNKAILQFMDRGSDVKAYASQRLAASSLRRLGEANEAVERLGERVEKEVKSCSVSPLNAGTQFVKGFTFGHMQEHLMHYGTLGYVFNCMRTPFTLQYVMYNAYQAMHSTDLGFEALKAMPDAELATRFGLPLVTRHTACAGTSIYAADQVMYYNQVTCKLKETEDIALSGARLNFEVQNEGKLKPYAQGLGEAVPEGTEGLARAVKAVVDEQVRVAAAKDGFAAARRTPTLDADDCENKALTEQMVARAIREIYRAHRTPEALLSGMLQEGKRSPHLFAACTKAHHELMAQVLFRLGRMLDAGDWTIDLAVASAKGPSYSEDDPQAGEGLCGHGASISRVRDAATGLFQHVPVEGTTYLCVDMPPPKGYPTELPLKLSTGEVKSFPLETIATVLAQNMHELVGLSQHAQVLARIRAKYSNALECPFYVSTFFTGLSEGSGGSMGCIPLDTCPPSMFRAGTKPLFGAPVMGLSNASTMAIPITAELLAEDGCPKKGKDLAELIRAQVSEAWGPSITEQGLRNYMTYLQPVESPDRPALTPDSFAATIRSENSWFYDDPKVTRCAVQVYSALARRFNELQARDPASDGATAGAYGQYLSAFLGISLPVPRSAAKFGLSTARNMRKAAEDIGLGAALAACVNKARMIRARAAVVTDHHVYMCSRGEGFVHSHRTKLCTK